MRRREAPPPTDSEILQYANVPVDVAAKYVGMSTSTIYYALQDERAPFGFAVRRKGSDGWTYNISPGLLVKYKNGDLPTYKLREVEALAIEGIERVIDSRLDAASRMLSALQSGME